MATEIFKGAGWTGNACIAVAALLFAPTTVRADVADANAPLLSVEDAVATAQRYNHLLASTSEGIAEAAQREAALRTRRLPVLHLDAWGGRTLNTIDFGIPAGSLGTIPQLGPVPPQDATLSVPKHWSALAVASVSQPLTQQYRIGLGIEVARLGGQIAREDLRRDRQRVAAQVRSTYYQLSATQAGLLAQRDTVRAVEELDTVTTRYLSEGLVLRSDGLDVKARLARERQRLDAYENALATQGEHLNQLLGRDVLTPFRVARPSDLVAPAAALTLEAARERAGALRPETRTAVLRTAQAETARRIAVSGWIPDLSLVAEYGRLFNEQVLPEEVSSVGLYFSWEPFDWGRKSHEASEFGHLRERTREARIETEQQIVIEVGQRWRAVKDAATLLEATRLETEASAASLETDRRRYRENAAILRDVLRTEALLSNARRDFTDALAGYWSAVAELERVVGNED